MGRSQLFATKSLQVLLDEMAGEHRLKRVLGPVTLTALGIGAVIGAGIFVATGEAAHDKAGPALMVSYAVAGVACVFAALCYAEFASMAPVAGSAYTYAYTTLGELFAWIIGWDLVLEYAVGAATVANGWSGYFQSVLVKLGIVLPMALVGAPHKYDQGHILPNLGAQYDGMEVTQKAIHNKEAQWPDGSVKVVDGIYWVRTKLEGGVPQDDLAQPAHEAPPEKLIKAIRVDVRRVRMDGVGVALGQEGDDPPGVPIARLGRHLPGLAKQDQAAHPGSIVERHQLVDRRPGAPLQVGVRIH